MHHLAIGAPGREKCVFVSKNRNGTDGVEDPEDGEDGEGHGGQRLDRVGPCLVREAWGRTKKLFKRQDPCFIVPDAVNDVLISVAVNIWDCL